MKGVNFSFLYLPFTNSVTSSGIFNQEAEATIRWSKMGRLFKRLQGHCFYLDFRAVKPSPGMQRISHYQEGAQMVSRGLTVPRWTGRPGERNTHSVLSQGPDSETAASVNCKGLRGNAKLRGHSSPLAGDINVSTIPQDVWSICTVKNTGPW